MYYWHITSGRWTNLISCHQGLKSCCGSSSKERVFLEGCPDSLYYLPPPPSGLSNYSDKSLKELTALPGKEKPQVKQLSIFIPNTSSAWTCHPIVNNHHQNGYYTRKTESLSSFISFVHWGNQLHISQGNHSLPESFVFGFTPSHLCCQGVHNKF